MGKVTLNFPNRGKGAKFEIPGLGVFENGTTTETDRTDKDLVFPATLEDGLKDKTKDELQEVASALGVSGRSSMTKDELTDAITEEGEL